MLSHGLLYIAWYNPWIQSRQNFDDSKNGKFKFEFVFMVPILNDPWINGLPVNKQGVLKIKMSR